MLNERNQKVTLGWISHLVVFLFPFLVMTACGVSSEKSSDEAHAVATQQAAEQAQADTGKKVESDQAAEKATADAPMKDSESAGAQVIEPKNASEPEIKLEPIPEPVSQSEPVAESVSASAETPETTPGGAAENAVTMAKIDETSAKPSASVAPIPVSTGADHFVITVAKKDQRHPNFGQGHEMGFLINGVPGGPVAVERGKTYRFEVATDPKHDVYLSTKPVGWGASPWSEGVEGAYIYQGVMTFTPTANAPDVLYYSCRNHPNMGGEIHVINPGEKVDLATLTQSAGGGAVAEQAGTTKSAKPEVSVAMVNQKLMFAEMLVNSAASTRVKSSDNDEAKQMQSKAENLVSQSKQELQNGNNQVAYSNAEEALVLLKSAAKLVPSEEEIVVLKENYKELQHSVHNFEQSHEESYQRMLKSGGEKAAVDYDKAQVAALKAEAEKLAQKNDYVNANKKLETAQRMITTAIQQMLHSQTIVYDLNFETPQEEYEYELKRFGGYEELIPVAVEQKQPNEGTKKLMESFVEKGQKMRDIAVETANAGDYPRAVAMLQDATTEIRRALRMVGVMQ